MKAIFYKALILMLLVFSLYQCNIIENDSLPTADAPAEFVGEIDESTEVAVPPVGASALSIPVITGILSEDVQILQEPSNGTLTIYQNDEQDFGNNQVQLSTHFLIFTPGPDFVSDEIIIGIAATGGTTTHRFTLRSNESFEGDCKFYFDEPAHIEISDVSLWDQSVWDELHQNHNYCLSPAGLGGGVSVSFTIQELPSENTRFERRIEYVACECWGEAGNPGSYASWEIPQKATEMCDYFRTYIVYADIEN